MSECQFCGGSGYSSIGAMCRCPLGVALRLQSNYGVLAARPHTDAHDDRTEAITGPDDDLTPDTMAERLAKTPPPIDRIPTPDHFICSTIGCSNRVSADNRKCWDCQAEEEASDYDPADDRLAILLYGIVLGVGLALVAVWLGWVRL